MREAIMLGEQIEAIFEKWRFSAASAHPSARTPTRHADFAGKAMCCKWPASDLGTT
jgi:hypothetical protein